MNVDSYFSTILEKEKKLLFRFPLTNGGIGDMIKFFLCALDTAIKYNMRICFLKSENPITKYIIPKCEHIYITEKELAGSSIIQAQNYIQVEELVNSINNTTIVQVFSNIFYDLNMYDIANKYNISDIFTFSSDIYEMREKYSIVKDYISVHIRRGDKHIESVSSVKQVPHDSRPFEQANFDNMINKLFNDNKDVMLFSDSMVFKKMMCKKFENLKCLDIKIGHTTWTNTSDEQIKNTVFEFYVLCNSTKIIANCVSGFSKIASMFNKIDIEHYETDVVPSKY